MIALLVHLDLLLLMLLLRCQIERDLLLRWIALGVLLLILRVPLRHLRWVAGGPSPTSEWNLGERVILRSTLHFIPFF